MNDYRPKRSAAAFEELVAEVSRRTGIDEAEVRRALAIVDAAAAAGWKPASEDRPYAESIKEQYQRAPNIGQPFPAWGEKLIDHIGVTPEQREYAHDLLKRVMVTVGVDETAVSGLLYDANDILRQSPIEAIRARVWGALDALLRMMFVGPMP